MLNSVSLYDKIYPLVLQCHKGVFAVSFRKLQSVHVVCMLDSDIVTCMNIINWNWRCTLRYVSCIKERKRNWFRLTEGPPI